MDAILSQLFSARQDDDPYDMDIVTTFSKKDQHYLLFVTIKLNLINYFKHLLMLIDLDIEYTGYYKLESVTPLWLAAVNNNIEMCNILITKGANVNALSSKGSSIIKSACSQTNIDIVKLLINNGADIHKANILGSTCLMSSIQSIALMNILIDIGADINAVDHVNLDSALHLAVKSNKINATKVLIKRGANYLKRNIDGDDALQTACLDGNKQIVKYLISVYPKDRSENALLLLGSVLYTESYDIEDAIIHFKESIKYRNTQCNVAAERCSEMSVILNKKLFDTCNDLDTSNDNEMIIQCVLINERVLGSDHNHSTEVMMKRYSNIKLLKYMLLVQIKRDPTQYDNIGIILDNILGLIFSTERSAAAVERSETSNAIEYDFVDIYEILENLVRTMPIIMINLKQLPVYLINTHICNGLLKTIIHLIYYIDKMKKNDNDTALFKRLVYKINNLNLRTFKKNSLLHLVVTNSNFRFDQMPKIFPNFSVTRLLLEQGANVNSVNKYGSTPLHLANQKNFKQDRGAASAAQLRLSDILVSYGAHIDQKNKYGNDASHLYPHNPFPLKCIVSKYIIFNKIPINDIPNSLVEFIKLH